MFIDCFTEPFWLLDFLSPNYYDSNSLSKQNNSTCKAMEIVPQGCFAALALTPCGTAD